MRFFIIACTAVVFGWSFNSDASCVVTIGSIPNPTEVGDVLRNPGTGSSIQTISIPVNITCSSPELLEFSSQNAKFQAQENNAYIVTYTARASGLTDNSNLEAPQPSSFVSLGTMTSATVSGSFVFQVVATQNLQPSTYSERITIRAGGGSGQLATFDISGYIPTDCSISVSSIPDPSLAGEILQDPSGRSITVPVQFACNTYQAKLSVSAQNGFFKPESSLVNVNVPYQVSISPGALTSSSPVLLSQSIANSWTEIGYLAATNSSANVLITPLTTSLLPSGTYSETVFLRINAP